MIRAERLRAAMTQNQLAAAAQVSTETIRKYEAGDRTPSRERLISILDAMQVPPSRAASVLVAAGYAPRRLPSPGAGPVVASAGPASLAAAVQKVPWPRLLVDEMLGVVAANPPFARLLGLEPSFHFRRTRAQLNLVAVLAAPTVASHLGNLDQCLGWAMGGLKARLVHGHAPDAGGTLADEVLAQCIAQDSVGARRIMGLWEAAPIRSRHSGSVCPVVWATPDGARVQMVAVETRVNGAHGPTLIDWHAADAASHARLEAILEAAGIHADREVGRPTRHSLRP